MLPVWLGGAGEACPLVREHWACKNLRCAPVVGATGAVWADFEELLNPPKGHVRSLPGITAGYARRRQLREGLDLRFLALLAGRPPPCQDAPR